MKFAWKTVSTACSLMLLACGGSGGNAAVSKTFNYGAPRPPTAGEQTAAASAQSAISDTAEFGSSPDATKAASIFGMANELAIAALGGALIPGRFVPEPNPRQALSTAATFDACAKVDGKTVTFKNCTMVESGLTFTLNGTVTASTGAVGWDVTSTVSGTDSGVTLNVNIHESGSLKVTSTTVVGNALLEVGGSASGNGQNVSFGVHVATIVDLAYRTSPSCVTAGSIEVKRVWTQVPNGASGSEFTDAAVKLTWTGCDSVLVAHSQ